MAVQNLGNVRALIVGATAPTNTNLLWKDTSLSPPITKEYDSSTSTWEPLRIDTSDFILQSEKGVADGVASLDSTGRVPTAQLPTSTVNILGTFGSADSTTGGDLPSSGNTLGDVYICDTDGYTSAVAGLTFDSGDWAFYDSSGNWEKVPGQGGVQSDWTETDPAEAAYILNKPFTTTQEDRLKALVYEEATATLSRNVDIFEKGLTSSTSVTVAWTVVANDDIITSINITNLTGPFGNTGSEIASITATTTWQMTVQRTDSEGGAASNIVQSVTSTAVVPKFYGVSSSNTYPATDPYTDLTKLVQSSASITLQTFNPTDEYVWFITTKSTGVIRDANGFVQTSDFDVTAISLSLPDATTENAWIYVTKTVKTLDDFQYELE